MKAFITSSLRVHPCHQGNRCCLIKALDNVIIAMISTLIYFSFSLRDLKGCQLTVMWSDCFFFFFLFNFLRSKKALKLKTALTWQDVVVAVLSSVFRHSGDIHRLVTADILQILNRDENNYICTVINIRTLWLTRPAKICFWRKAVPFLIRVMVHYLTFKFQRSNDWKAKWFWKGGQVKPTANWHKHEPRISSLICCEVGTQLEDFQGFWV